MPAGSTTGSPGSCTRTRCGSSAGGTGGLPFRYQMMSHTTPPGSRDAAVNRPRQHSSSSRCQSRPVRASRDISMPSTMPARPIVTSVTSLANPFPGIGRRGRYPQVVVDHDDLRACPAQRDRPLGQRVLQPRRSGMLKHLLPAFLADIHDRCPVQVLRRIFCCGCPCRRYLARLITTASCRADRSPGRQHRRQRHHRSPPFRRQHRPDQGIGSHRIPGARPHRAHPLPLTAAGEPPLPPATVLPRSVSAQIRAPR